MSALEPVIDRREARTFECPDCRHPMRRIEGRLIGSLPELWLCDACRSQIVPFVSLRTLAPSQAIDELRTAFGDATAAHRPCPRCAEPMRTARVRGSAGLVSLDACTPCDLLWFDRAELAAVRAAMTDATCARRPTKVERASKSARRVALLRQDAIDEAGGEAIAFLLNFPRSNGVRAQLRAAPVTLGLTLIVCVTSGVALSVDKAGAIARAGLVPSDLFRGNVFGLVSHFFLHANVAHLLGNMLVFLPLGATIENLAGHRRLLAILGASVVGAAVSHAILAPERTVPMIGASGGIAGLFAALVVMRPAAKVATNSFLIGGVNILGQFVVWIASQIWGLQLQMSRQSAVSALAHLGGAGVGLLLGAAFRYGENRRTAREAGR